MATNNLGNGPDSGSSNSRKNRDATRLVSPLEPPPGVPPKLVATQKEPQSPVAATDGGAAKATDGGAAKATDGGAAKVTDGGAAKVTDGGAAKASLRRKTKSVETPDSNEPQEFAPDIAAAFAAYHAPPLSPHFEAHFWKRFEARRGRYRGFTGLLRRVWELEIEGVLVWRLALSMLSGGATCALFFALAIGFSRTHNAPLETPVIAANPPGSLPEIPDTPRLAFDGRAFYAREWEFDRVSQLKITPRPRALPKTEGGISWLGSAHPLV